MLKEGLLNNLSCVLIKLFSDLFSKNFIGKNELDVGTRVDLINFLKQNREAYLFAWKASDDYLLARLGILNALWSGFEMATQATEKLLKSYILFADKRCLGNTDNMRKMISARSKGLGRKNTLGHDVEACLAIATEAGILCSNDLQSRITRINLYYLRRYPNEDAPSSLSTEEIQDVDEAVFEIWDAFKSINEDYYYTSGFMIPVYSAYLSNQQDNSLAFPFHIITANNKAYESRQPDFVNEIKSRLAKWYPHV